MIRNRIVTRGFSKSGRNLLVTEGFIPGIFERIQQAAVRIIRGKRPSDERRRIQCDEFRIKVSLVRINDKELSRPISNMIRVVICPNPNIFVRTMGSIRAVVIETVRSIFIRAGFRWKQ